MIKIVSIEDKKQWENFVLSSHPNVFLQSWNWGEFHRLMENKIFRLGVFEGRKLVGVALVIKEEAKRGRYFTIPGGPILINWDDFKLSKAVFNKLKHLGAEEEIDFIRVRPPIPDTPRHRRLFRKLGFRDAPMHLHAETTLQLDLSQSEEEILAGMRKTTRYLIRRAEREGVKTEVSKNVGDVDILYRLQMEAWQRHKFVPFSKEFFEKHFKAFVGDDQIVLIKANYQNETLAIGMFIFYGDTATYHYSGSSSKHFKIPSSYAMLWRAIREAKKRHCRVFDLWGIAPSDDPRHRFAGVTLFKKGFGGQRVDHLHAQDLPLKKSYWLTYVFETIRRWRRRL